MCKGVYLRVKPAILFSAYTPLHTHHGHSYGHFSKKAQKGLFCKKKRVFLQIKRVFMPTYCNLPGIL